jgi:nitrite reductase/ring-hydroxylating ferredoxin subunit
VTTTSDHSPAPTAVAVELDLGVDDIPAGSLRLARAGGRRLCIARTVDGALHALDHACPHEGYGLTQGTLDGDLLTCAWHNWKFRVADGVCVLGEEDVPAYPVSVRSNGRLEVELSEPDPAARRPVLLASLRRAIERDYLGQLSRDVVRLLRADANPGELVWEAVAYGAPRSEFGWGHSVASATDCLAMVDQYTADQRALPVVQALAGIAEVERGRPMNPLPVPAEVGRHAGAEFRAAVEAEQLELAQALVLGAIEAGRQADDLRPWFTAVVSDHHLSYGHGAIYSQKAFELLEMIGWDRAATVLAHLVPTLVFATREDTLAYMRRFDRGVRALDLPALADAPVDDGWADDGSLLAALLGADRHRPLDAALGALRAGAGVDGLLDVVVAAVSERMLRYDTDGEFDFHDDFGWLDITHGLTYANAARWHHAQTPGPDSVRLALWTVFLAHYTGRHEWHTRVGERHAVDLPGTVADAALDLQAEALRDGTSQFIVHAHAVKTSRAAAAEAVRAGTDLPLQAVARFLRAPKLERFVASNVTRAIDFLSGHGPASHEDRVDAVR